MLKTEEKFEMASYTCDNCGYIVVSGENINVINWAFEKGYNLGNTDKMEGAHIDFSETQRFFLKELTEFLHSRNIVNCCT